MALTAYRIDEGRLQVRVVSTQGSASCPDCGTLSTQLYGHYLRYPPDLPRGGWRVIWELGVRRFRCRSPVCPRQTFGERFPDLAGAYQRQTRRLQSVLQALALAVGGEGAPGWLSGSA